MPVASANGDLYTPFPNMPVIEEGIQSSEEGSVLHSPIYEPSYVTPGGRYHEHLGHFDDAANQLLPPPSTFDARYSAPGVDPQARDPHFLDTLQMPSPTTIHHHLPPPHHPSTDLSLHGHPMLDLGGPSSRLQSGVMPSPSEYSMHLSQARLPEQHLRMSGEALPPLPPRHSAGMPAADSKPQITLPSASGSARTNPSSSNATQSRPPRREASNVVIACRQCRARKIRCDSTRPFCHNCLRRNNECEYDAVPKRRGPDKRPGTRQRSCKKRPPDAEPASASARKKRKTNAEGESGMLSFDINVKENVTGGARNAQYSSRGAMDDMNATHGPPQASLYIDTSIPPRGTGPDAIYPKDELSPSFRRSSVIMDFPDSTKSFARPIDVNISRQQHGQDRPSYTSLSSLNYGPDSWWDELLDQYNPTSREQSLKDIASDLTFLFTTTSYWLSFICLPIFLRDLHDPTIRGHMQPLIMSALAMATLMKSSDIEYGARGRELALSFHSRAQACLEIACRSQTFDYTLAEAALIMALFESSAHPLYSPERANNALQLLDRIIHVLSLTSIDHDDPYASSFQPRLAPVVDMPSGYRRPERCSCIGYPSSPTSPLVQDHLSQSYSLNPPWDPRWSETEIRKEECRRLCWCALTLVSNHTAYCSAFHIEPMELTLANPSNYALLFPGEAYERMPAHHQASGQSPKESIWALYCRSMLLWNSCVQRDETLTTEERANFAIDVFQETREVQDALKMHVCNLDTGLMYVCREYLYDTRMAITYELRRRLQDGSDVVPVTVDRRQAEEWLFYQKQVATRVKDSVLGLGETEGHVLSRRPFLATWFSSQVAICLSLWDYNRSLQGALELAKAFLVPLDVLNALWPCPVQASNRDELRRKVANACVSAGLHPPPPVEANLPPILHR
ncbi:hypothetical protein PYCCODRAFT_1451417 [Trametes coccinea BRFM310]|uniref:Zn(2)-C6 fungal-type domain-containing protein n=1 Tax=Trametes coccinea (strain BRFM310) TaxID=1353009 RepID=A0A1Y2IU23_TRAC3|nr:hypothetical protein PYCCODRAFT_1451417 [Trametes coccinea BRFM310]